MITFAGRPIPVEPGQTIAAALIAAGIRSWRTTRHDAAPRGLFCGIGACYDCLVTVNNAAPQRACLVVANDGDVIESIGRNIRDEGL
jgi:2Fe-2S iron-sulfur cluster protein